MFLQKVTSKKLRKEKKFCWYLKVNDENSRIRIRRRIRIRTKLSSVRNTGAGSQIYYTWKKRSCAATMWTCCSHSICSEVVCFLHPHVIKDTQRRMLCYLYRLLINVLTWQKRCCAATMCSSCSLLRSTGVSTPRSSKAPTARTPLGFKTRCNVER